MLFGPALGQETEDDLDLFKSMPAQLSARHCSTHGPAVCLGKGKVNQPVVFEAGVQDHVQQSALAVLLNAWQTTDGVGMQRPCCADEPQATGPLRDQHAPVRQKGQAPGMVQTIGDDLVGEGWRLTLYGLRRKQRR